MIKKHKYWLLLFYILGIFLVVGIKEYMRRKPRYIEVYGRMADYTYCDRKLSVSDFEQFDYNSTYEDVVNRIGLENGTIGSGILRPYYELGDGRFVIWNEAYGRKSIAVVNDKCHEYYILPPELTQKSDFIKNRETETAQQSEINSILWMLEMQELVIKNYYINEFSENDGKNISLGKYTTELLKRYTNRDIDAEISYYFGSYREYGAYPLIQTIWLYEEQKTICFGYVLWDTDTYWHSFFVSDIESEEDEDDCIAHAERYKLKGQENILSLEDADIELNVINLSPDKIANSLTDFLIKQKVIKNKRNSCVEFWGDDGNGKYACLISANSWKIGWDINAGSRGTKYYFVTMDTLDDTVISINVELLNRIFYERNAS